MIDRKDAGSRTAGPATPDDLQGWPGQRLGLPQSGPGSIARLGRRVVALLIDWGLCLLISYAFFHYSTSAQGAATLIPVGVLLGENILLVGTGGATVGHRVMGLRVTAFDRPAGILRAAVRSVLLVVVVPAVIWDADQRGMHDRASGTVLVRTR